MLRPLPELFAARVPSMKFLLVDDHPLVRPGLADVVARAGVQLANGNLNSRAHG